MADEHNCRRDAEIATLTQVAKNVGESLKSIKDELKEHRKLAEAQMELTADIARQQERMTALAADVADLRRHHETDTAELKKMTNKAFERIRCLELAPGKGLEKKALMIYGAALSLGSGLIGAMIMLSVKGG